MDSKENAPSAELGDTGGGSDNGGGVSCSDGSGSGSSGGGSGGSNGSGSGSSGGGSGGSGGGSSGGGSSDGSGGGPSSNSGNISDSIEGTKPTDKTSTTTLRSMMDSMLKVTRNREHQRIMAGIDARRRNQRPSRRQALFASPLDGITLCGGHTIIGGQLQRHFRQQPDEVSDDGGSWSRGAGDGTNEKEGSGKHDAGRDGDTVGNGRSDGGNESGGDAKDGEANSDTYDGTEHEGVGNESRRHEDGNGGDGGDAQERQDTGGEEKSGGYGRDQREDGTDERGGDGSVSGHETQAMLCKGKIENKDNHSEEKPDGQRFGEDESSDRDTPSGAALSDAHYIVGVEQAEPSEEQDEKTQSSRTYEAENVSNTRSDICAAEQIGIELAESCLSEEQELPLTPPRIILPSRAGETGSQAQTPVTLEDSHKAEEFETEHLEENEQDEAPPKTSGEHASIVPPKIILPKRGQFLRGNRPVRSLDGAMPASQTSLANQKKLNAFSNYTQNISPPREMLQTRFTVGSDMTKHQLVDYPVEFSVHARNHPGSLLTEDNKMIFPVKTIDSVPQKYIEGTLQNALWKELKEEKKLGLQAKMSPRLPSNAKREDMGATRHAKTPRNLPSQRDVTRPKQHRETPNGSPTSFLRATAPPFQHEGMPHAIQQQTAQHAKVVPQKKNMRARMIDQDNVGSKMRTYGAHGLNLSHKETGIPPNTQKAQTRDSQHVAQASAVASSKHGHHMNLMAVHTTVGVPLDNRNRSDVTGLQQQQHQQHVLHSGFVQRSFPQQTPQPRQSFPNRSLQQQVRAMQNLGQQNLTRDNLQRLQHMAQHVGSSALQGQSFQQNAAKVTQIDLQHQIRVATAATPHGHFSPPSQYSRQTSTLMATSDTATTNQARLTMAASIGYENIGGQNLQQQQQCMTQTTIGALATDAGATRHYQVSGGAHTLMAPAIPPGIGAQTGIRIVPPSSVGVGANSQQNSQQQKHLREPLRGVLAPQFQSPGGPLGGGAPIGSLSIGNAPGMPMNTMQLGGTQVGEQHAGAHPFASPQTLQPRIGPAPLGGVPHMLLTGGVPGPSPRFLIHGGGIAGVGGQGTRRPQPSPVLHPQRSKALAITKPDGNVVTGAVSPRAKTVHNLKATAETADTMKTKAKSEPDSAKANSEADSAKTKSDVKSPNDKKMRTNGRKAKRKWTKK